MNEIAESVLSEYLDKMKSTVDTREEPTFFQVTLYRWAGHEILQLIRDNPFDDPDMLITEFMMKMDYFSTLKKEGALNFGFSVAKEAALDMLRLFL